MTGGLIDDDQGGICVDQIFRLKQIGEKAREKKRRVYVGFIDLEKAYDRVNMKALWRVLRIFNVGINCCVELRICTLIVQGENERFIIDSGVRQGCIISSWLFNEYGCKA